MNADGMAYTERFEGRRRQSYDDATGETIFPNDRDCLGHPRKGTLTIGVGHTDHDFVTGDVWSDAKITEVFTLDYSKAMHAALNIFGPLFIRLTLARQAVIADLCFELGEAGLRKFGLFCANVRSGNWDAAALCLEFHEGKQEKGHTLYWEQTTIRALSNAMVLRKGTF